MGNAAIAVTVDVKDGRMQICKHCTFHRQTTQVSSSMQKYAWLSTSVLSVLFHIFARRQAADGNDDKMVHVCDMLSIYFYVFTQNVLPLSSKYCHF
jgi:hypothetical protein